MKEQIIEFVNEYAVWGILFAVLLAVFVLWRMQRQLKKLNRNLSTVTEKIQEYFDVIMEEDEESYAQPISTEETRIKQRTPVKEESPRVQRRKPNREDEAIIREVLQEYFS